MTWALCFNCGARKFGAICPCPECQVASTGNLNLDIAFSDHHISVETIEAFGAVVRAIRRVCEDDELRFWSFVSYVSSHHPEILSVDLASQQRERCAEVLARANPPPVTIRESGSARFMREHRERDQDA